MTSEYTLTPARRVNLFCQISKRDAEAGVCILRQKGA